MFLSALLPPPGQTYHYHMHTTRIHNPFTLRYRHHQRQALDVGAMRRAAACMVGVHDFTQFSNQNDQRLKRNPVKLLQRVDVLDAEDGLRVEVGVLWDVTQTETVLPVLYRI